MKRGVGKYIAFLLLRRLSLTKNLIRNIYLKKIHTCSRKNYLNLTKLFLIYRVSMILNKIFMLNRM